jgi:uncharacterized membrane protein
MKQINFKSNFFYGALVVVPIVIFIILIVELVDIIKNVSQSLGLESDIGGGLAVALLALVMIAACYGAGVAVKTRIGSMSFGSLERRVLAHVPGYRIVSNALKGFADNEKSYPPVLARLSESGTAVLGVVIEENDNDTFTVFVPTAPAITIGGVYILDRNRVTYLDASTLDFVNCVAEWGVGSSKLIGDTKIM